MEGKRVSHYEIVRLLGRGGMGEVYEAVDLNLDRRPVALKFIAPEMAGDPESLGRFEREAASAARLKHANIATVHAFVREGALPFIDMELMPGTSLRARIAHGPLPVADALAIARDVASALAHAHRRGVVHRDIKPENLMFDESGAVKVTDFGLARAAQASKLTMTGTTLGTAGYMSPEAVRGQAAAPADVFALGVVLYEMLAGAMPFAGDQPLAQMYAIANEPPQPLRDKRPDAPDAVVALVERLLDKDPAKRPDAAAAAIELAALTGAAPPRLEPVTEEHEVERLQRADSAAMTAAMTIARPQRRAVPRARIAAILVGGFGTAGIAILFGVALPQQRARARQEAVALNNQGYERLAAGDAVGARALFEAALAKRGDYGEALVNLGHALRVLGRADSSAQVLTAALAKSDKDPALAAAAHFNLAENDLDAGAYPSAVEHLERAEALDSTVLAYAGNRVFALVRAGRYPEALAAGQRALARFPGDPGLGKNVGYALVLSGRASEALPYLDRAIAASSAPGGAYGVRAIAYAALGRRADAARDWRRFLDSEPADLEREALDREYRAHGGVAVLPAPGADTPVPPPTPRP